MDMIVAKFNCSTRVHCQDIHTRTRSKQGWRTIGGRTNYYRSAWEANYARYLEWQLKRGEIQAWEHEPKTYWFLEIKRGTRSFLPDFSVLCSDGIHSVIEVKGYMDSKSATKIKRFKKYFPDIPITVITESFFKNNPLKNVIPGWE